MNVRAIEIGDAENVTRLYAHYVLTSCATFEEDAPDAAEILNRIDAVLRAGLPWRVAYDDGGALQGYAYASPYRTRSAYRYTVENSVYVAPGCVRRGVGLTLMGEIIAACARSGYRQMLAVIGDSDNIGSIELHARLGFRMIGTHPAIGFKFGRWIDVVHMQRAL